MERQTMPGDNEGPEKFTAYSCNGCKFLEYNDTQQRDYHFLTGEPITRINRRYNCGYSNQKNRWLMDIERRFYADENCPLTATPARNEGE